MSAIKAAGGGDGGINHLLNRWERKQSLAGLAPPAIDTTRVIGTSAHGTGSGSKTPKTPKTPLGAAVANNAANIAAGAAAAAGASGNKTPGGGLSAKPKTPSTGSSASARKRAGSHGSAYGDRFIPSRDNDENVLAGAGGAAVAAAIKNADAEDTLVLSSVLQPARALASNDGKAAAGGSAAGGGAGADGKSAPADARDAKLAEAVGGENAGVKSKILSFKTKAPKPAEAYQNRLRVLYSQNKSGPAPVKRTLRNISTTPERILDAPELTNDFYLNLMDWSTTDVLAVGLHNQVVLWNAADQSVMQLMECKAQDEIVTSVAWMADGLHLAIGTSTNEIQMWNAEESKRVRTMGGSHTMRIGALAWNEHILSSGSRDSTIVHHDVRVARHETAVLRGGAAGGHTQEICGLKWSPDGRQLASGGNDNVVCIWDADKVTPKFVFTESQAAVKALAWCPFQQHLLATGGGTADRHIRFYNTASGQLVHALDSKSQVCSLVWSHTERELVSAHGFSQNHLSVWKYPSLVRVVDLPAHTERILHTALSPDGTTIASAAADETLKFWRIWDASPAAAAKKKAKDGGAAAGVPAAAPRTMTMNIR